jgi:hypothetical protein
MEIEATLDQLDPDSEEYAALNAEADEIADGLNRVDAAYKDRILAQEAAKQAKIDRIRELDSLGKTDQMISEYGEEFINDYHVQSNTITSNVSEEQWCMDDEGKTDAKLKQLLYYRIYDHYVRDRPIRR